MHPDLIFQSFGIQFDTGRARNSRKPGPAGCAQRLKSAAPGRCLKPCPYLVRTRRVHLRYPPVGRAHSAGTTASEPLAGFRFFFLFSDRTLVTHVDGPKTIFSGNLSIFGRPGVDFRRFWVPKQVPAAYFFGDFSKLFFRHFPHFFKNEKVHLDL